MEVNILLNVLKTHDFCCVFCSVKSKASQGGDPEQNEASRKHKKKKEKSKSKYEVLTVQEPPRIEVHFYLLLTFYDTINGPALIEIQIHTGFLSENLQHSLR